MDHPEVKAIFCSRGGYGAVHLIDKLDFTAFRKHPKWLIGYSDVTTLHNLFRKMDTLRYIHRWHIILQWSLKTIPVLCI